MMTASCCRQTCVLSVPGNSLGNSGVKAIALGLKKNSTLRHLYLGGAWQFPLAMCPVTVTLLKLTALEPVALHPWVAAGNEISDDGVAALAEALLVNSTLQKLGLSRTYWALHKLPHGPPADTHRHDYYCHPSTHPHTYLLTRSLTFCSLCDGPLVNRESNSQGRRHRTVQCHCSKPAVAATRPAWCVHAAAVLSFANT